MTKPINAAHWGAFRMRVENDRLVGVEPFEHDPAPSSLIANIPEIVHSPDRIHRPLVRRGWLAGDGGAGRGSDAFDEIDWDHALDLCAAELRRVIAEHGNQTIFGGSYGWASAGRIHHARSLLHRFLNTIGGFTGQVTNYSYGAAMAFLPHLVGREQAMNTPVPELAEVAEHAELLLAFGGLPEKNWQIQSGGFGLHALPAQLAALRDKGTEVVCITPFRGDIPSGLPARWLPIRPGTDTALMLALLWCVIDARAADCDFLDRCTSGFDRLEDYVTGRKDGTPKDPDWAACITGIPAAEIAALGARLGQRRSMLTATWSLQRARNGEQPYWALVALAAALGGIGLPGQGFAFGYGSMNGIGNAGWQTPLFGLSKGKNPFPPIPVARVTDMLLHPGETYRFNGVERSYPDIRLVWWAGGNPFHHHQDLNRMARALQRPDTVIVNEQVWTATARHADIVLPATTSVERSDIGGSSRDPFILAMQQGISPVGEARDDYAIFANIAARMGSGEAFTEGRSADDWVRWSWERSRDALSRRGIDAPDFETFWAQGCFRLPDPQAAPEPPFAAFRADPANHPLSTRSGRIEIAGPTLGALSFGELPDHPAWLRLEDEEDARDFLDLLTPQPAGRLHSQGERAAPSLALRVDGLERIDINPVDAAKRGVADGAYVLVRNQRGCCRAVARVTADVAPGVVLLPTGAAFERAADGTQDGSNPNVLTEDIGTSVLGQGCSANTCRVEILPDA